MTVFDVETILRLCAAAAVWASFFYVLALHHRGVLALAAAPLRFAVLVLFGIAVYRTGVAVADLTTWGRRVLIDSGDLDAVVSMAAAMTVALLARGAPRHDRH